MTIINENCVVYKQLDTCTRMTIINENFVTYKSLHTPGRQSYRKITYHVCDPLNFEKLKKPLIRRRVICVILNVYFVSYKSDCQKLKRIRRVFFIHTPLQTDVVYRHGIYYWYSRIKRVAIIIVSSTLYFKNSFSINEENSKEISTMSVIKFCSKSLPDFYGLVNVDSQNKGFIVVIKWVVFETV